MTPPSLSARRPGVPPRRADLRILQLNMPHSSYSLDLLVQFLQHDRHDIVLIQDPPEALQSGRRSLPGYEVFLSRPCCWQPNNPSARRSLIAILARTSLCSQPCPRTFRRACGILVETQQGTVALLSAYIRHLCGEGLEDLSHAHGQDPPTDPFYGYWGRTSMVTVPSGDRRICPAMPLANWWKTSSCLSLWKY